MNLYVWDEFAPDWSDGLAFAIAPSLERARELVEIECGYSPSDWGPYTEYPVDEETAEACTGGS